MTKVTALMLALAFTSQWCCCLWGIHGAAVPQPEQVIAHDCCVANEDDATAGAPSAECAHASIDNNRQLTESQNPSQHLLPQLVVLPCCMQSLLPSNEQVEKPDLGRNESLLAPTGTTLTKVYCSFLI